MTDIYMEKCSSISYYRNIRLNHSELPPPPSRMTTEITTATLHYVTDETIRQYRHFGKEFDSFFKVNTYLPYDPVLPKI